LPKILSNENLKYCKIPFGNGIGKQSLGKSTFPTEDTLMETTCFQSYRNWLMVIDMIVTPKVAVGWYEHHSRMLQDEHFFTAFDAWNDMDKQLHTQFINHPFAIDPEISTYTHLLEQAHMNTFLAHCAKSQQTFESHHSFWTYPPYNLPHTDASGSSATCYVPYDKAHSHDSFWDGKKPILFLQCGIPGHQANACSSMHSSHPECPIICDWKGKLAHV